ncbi:hypothetical protein EHP00_2221 [Ecytonucleospora hepatopenaei]|uniref:Uncharacterized protein n=1 Tax=Ecytonucleospora hepatopenaei TaxID=646526 RepID=A0A1W0E529_9MICR|nr:hypothetical protein EHP00_2221 [Ecytonucleospora hepatopenaei]
MKLYSHFMFNILTNILYYYIKLLTNILYYYKILIGNKIMLRINFNIFLSFSLNIDFYIFNFLNTIFSFI